MKKRNLLWVLLVLMSLGTQAQVLIQFNAGVDGTVLDRLGNVHIQCNLPELTQAKLEITVSQGGVGLPLVKIQTPVFWLRPGLNVPGAQTMAASNFQFGAGPAAQNLAQTHRFTDGEYDYCFSVTLINAKSQTDYFENCFDYNVQVMTPLTLMNPYDREKTCDRRPNLLWQPILPMQPDLTYTVILCEEQLGQTKAEAINFNRALIFQSGISGNSLNYPPLAHELDSSRTYAWQVWGIRDNTIVVKSEIWEFTIDCSGDTLTMNRDSYREMSEELDASSYLAKDFLHFSFYNSYGPYHLNYSIVDLSKQNKVVKNLPDLTAIHGHNKLDIDLTDLSNMVSGDQYLLKVKTKDGKVLQLKFVYSE